MKLVIQAYLTDNRYFDVFTEYAKNDEEDICIRISVYNRSADKCTHYCITNFVDAKSLVIWIN